MNLTVFAKKYVAATLYYSGFIRCIQSRNEKPGVILAYHRVLPNNSDEISFIQPGMYVTSETFERHMVFISKNFKIMRLEDLADNQKPKNACIVTFDDGWADNYTHAFPILKKYGIPATIFLTTNVIGTSEWPWSDRIGYYIQTVPLKEFAYVLEGIMRDIGMESPWASFRSKDRQFFREQVINQMKTMDNQTILSLMERLDKNMSNKKECLMRTRPWLAWNEVMEMRKGGVSFGSHTHNHLILTRIPFHQAQNEIAISKRILSEKMGTTVNLFCYPNGDFNDEIIRTVADTGYKVAVTTRRGFINESRNLLALRRLMMHNDMTSSIPMLACVMSNRIPFF